MMYFEKGIEFGIRSRLDKKVNVWCQMKSTSLGIESNCGETNEFPVETTLGVFDDQWEAMDFCSRMANELRNEFSRHVFVDAIAK